MLTLREAVDKLREKNLVAGLKNFKESAKRATFCCPFHYDIRPSANLYEYMGSVFFHCFGCNKTMTFEEFWAELTGEKVQKEKRLQDGYKFDLKEFAEGLHFRFLLLLEGNGDWRFPDEVRLAQKGLEYLQSRGFDKEDIRRYHIGFFYGKLREHKEIEGMQEFAEKNRWLSTSECFLTFPVYSEDFEEVRTIQFEDFLGRGQRENTKYFLAGLPIPVWYSEKFNENYSWVICEGIYDAMSMAKTGYPAIATLGNPLTEEKKKCIRKCKEIILCFDNDDAGRKYSEAIKKELATSKIRVYEFILPEKDPNELLAKEGVAGIEKLEPVEVDFFPSWDKKIDMIIARYEASKEKAIAIPNEFKYLQDFFPHGFLQGLYAIAGIPGVGKTTFLNLLCHELAKLGVYSIYFLTEEPEYVLMARIKEKEGVKSIKDLKYLDFLKFRITIEMSMEYRTEKLKEIAEGILNRVNSDRVILVVDSLQALRLSEEREGRMSIREKTILKTEYLSHIARDLQVPVFFTSFVAREFYKEEPNLSVFKESGDIEYLIDVGIAMWMDADEAGKDERKIKFSILKNRFGKVGNIEAMFTSKNFLFKCDKNGSGKRKWSAEG